jgi:hypothetical protein
VKALWDLLTAFGLRCDKAAGQVKLPAMHACVGVMGWR